MIENIELPEELLINIGTETKEFAIRSRLQRPVGKSLGRVFFGIFWLGFISLFIFLFLGPVFNGEETQIIQNGKNITVSPGNLKPALFILIFFGVFVLIGLWILIPGLISLFKRGGYFVGTAQRLVRYKKGHLKSLDWSQFTGNIEVRGNNKKGNIALEMRTGSMVSGKGGSRYVPDVVYLVGIPAVYEIEKILRRRIEEHGEK